MSANHSPKKGKKGAKRDRSDEDNYKGMETPRKKFVVFEDDSEGEDSEEEASSEISTDLLQVGKMQKHLKEFRSFLEENKKMTTSAKNMKHQAAAFVQSMNIEEPERFCSSLLHYLKSSLRLSTLSCGTGLRVLDEYLDRGELIKLDPEFPKPPPATISIYLRQHSADAAKLPPGKERSALLANLSKDPEKKELAEAEHAKLEADYLAHVKDFLEQREEEMTKNQVAFVNNLISRLEKKVNPAPKTPRTPKTTKNVKAPREELTPFQLFVAANRDKYTDCDEEKRMKKLTKKFDKLDADTRNMFVNMSMSL